jgi:hypothetical protein
MSEAPKGPVFITLASRGAFDCVASPCVDFALLPNGPNRDHRWGQFSQCPDKPTHQYKSN